ncbi:MAG: transposase [Anaerolineales bacterium]|nr:transposase [Anaerolineales bacterium]
MQVSLKRQGFPSVIKHRVARLMRREGLFAPQNGEVGIL